MINGTVKWFNDAKGFGFIEPEGGGTDIFAHFSCIAMEGFKTLKQGARVTFELTQGPKGHLAQNIRELPDLDGLPPDDDDVPEEPVAGEIVNPRPAPRATPKPVAKAPARRTLRVRAPQYDFSGQES